MWLLILRKKYLEPSAKNLLVRFVIIFTTSLLIIPPFNFIIATLFPYSIKIFTLKYSLPFCLGYSILMTPSMAYVIKLKKIESLIITKNLQFDLSLTECFYKFLGYFSSNEPLILKSSLSKKKICAQVEFQKKIVQIDLKFSEMAPQKTNLFIIVSSKDRSFKNSDLENILQDIERDLSK